MSEPTDICPGCRELWTKLPTLHFCTPQNAPGVDSDAVAAEVAPRAGRPDLKSIRAWVNGEPGILRPEDEHLERLLLGVLDYAESLERELAAARAVVEAAIAWANDDIVRGGFESGREDDLLDAINAYRAALARGDGEG